MGEKNIDPCMEVLERIAIKAHYGKKSESHTIKIYTSEQLHIVAHALLTYPGQLIDRPQRHQRPHEEQDKLLNRAKKLREDLRKAGMLGVYDAMGPVLVALKNEKIDPAMTRMGHMMANRVYDDLRDAGMSEKSAKQTRRFVKEALIAIARHPDHYKSDLFILAQHMLLLNSPIPPLPLQVQPRKPLDSYNPFPPYPSPITASV